MTAARSPRWPRTPRRLTDSYLDTADWRIARAGFVVRTRRRGRQRRSHPQGHSPGRGQRLAPAARGHRGPAPQRRERTRPRRPGRAGASGRSSAPIPCARCSRCRTRRRPFVLRVGGVDAAEIALDDTVIVVGNGQRPMQLRRVEVEVQPDWLRALEPIVAQLRSSCGLQPAHSRSSRPGCSPSARTFRVARSGSDRRQRGVDHRRARLRRAAAPVRCAAREGTRDPARRGHRRAPRHARRHPAPARRPCPLLDRVARAGPDLP